MTGSMYAAIAGLQTHMQKMNVIGNNIANANTYGFKPGVTSFSESMYTSISNSTAGGAQYGGTNASQIGYGSQVASIDLNMAGGTYAPTGINSHLYLDGSGFFLVGPKPDGENGYVEDPNDLILKRVGNFNIDSDGYLVDANGYCVYGFMPEGDENGNLLADTEGNITDWDTCLRPLRVPAAATAASGDIAEGDAIYPQVTGPGIGQGTSNTWEYPPDIYNNDNRIAATNANLSVNNNGVVQVTIDDSKIITVGVIAIGTVINPNGLTKESDGYYRAGNNAGSVNVGTCGGIIDAPYLNNVDEMQNPTQVAGRQTLGTGGGTTILSGGLESSKTDIATEFADLITTQRGFQANTKIITVTDEMLSDLVSMKR